MTDKEKSKKQLIQELTEMRERLVAAEQLAESLRQRGDRLVRSEMVHRIVADNTYDWEFWLGPAAEFIYTSPACERITGYSAEEFSADRTLLFRILHPDDITLVSENLHRMRAEIGVCEIEFRIIRRDGAERWIALAFQPVYDEGGQYLGIRGSNRDITDRKQMERELLRSQRYEAIGILADGMVHDFDDLLTSVLGSVALARTCIAVGNGEEAVRNLAKIEALCLQARNLSSRLLLLSRGGEPERRPTSITRILRESAIAAADQAKFPLRFDFAEDLWPADIDESQIRHVARHIIMNACEAMPGGGTIEIGAENVILGDETALPAKPGPYVKWSIRDQGIGIPQEAVPKLFDSSFTTKKGGAILGRGLGLAICYAVVSKHDGCIAVDAAPEKGTIVSVYLPALPILVREAEA